MNSRFFIFSIILLIGSILNSYAVQDSLILYTKPDCSNCHAVKKVLNKSGIPFIEKTLSNDLNAAEMLKKLEISGFKGDIYLPVIYLNTNLCHPAYAVNNKLISLPIEDVIDTLRLKFYNKEINLSSTNQVKSEIVEPSGNSDCEMKVPLQYLICKIFDKEEDATKEMNSLINKGYIYAGYLRSKNKFSVFSKFSYDKSALETELNEIKKIYSDAYIVEISD